MSNEKILNRKCFQNYFFCALCSVHFYYFKHTFIWEKGRLINIHNFSNHFVIIYASSGFAMENRNDAKHCKLYKFKNEALNIYTIKSLHRTEEPFLFLSIHSIFISLFIPLTNTFICLCLWIFQLCKYKCMGYALYVTHNRTVASIDAIHYMFYYAKCCFCGEPPQKVQTESTFNLIDR